MKTWLAVLILSLADTSGNIFLTRGMKQVGEVSTLRLAELLRIGRRAVSNPALLFGIFSMAIAFFCLLALLSWDNLSFVLPATALGPAFSVLGAKYMLKEQVSPARWFGTIFICLGVALISVSSRIQ
jgi:drug/metabolite transporter (DMT)-like permease